MSIQPTIERRKAKENERKSESPSRELRTIRLRLKSAGEAKVRWRSGLTTRS